MSAVRISMMVNATISSTKVNPLCFRRRMTPLI
jgi:hypothetical protein